MPATLPDSLVNLVGLEDIQDGGRGGITIRPTPPREIDSLKTRFQPGDILYGKLRPYLNKVGLSEANGLCSTEIWAFTVQDFADSRFVTSFLASQPFVDRVSTFTKGANLPRLDTEAFDSVEIPLPPLSEQKRIVEILQEAEAIRRLRSEAEAKTAELIPAMFEELFGDVYNANSLHPRFSLAELGELDRGRSRHRPRDEPSLYGGPYPFVQTGDVAQSNGWITSHSQTYSEKGLAQSRLWPKGTLAITIAANIGATAILTFDACFPDSVVGFTPKRGVSPQFIKWWLWGYQKKLESQAAQGTQKKINLEVLRNIQVPTPREALQSAFDNCITELHQSLVHAQKGTVTTTALLASLSAHAFSGALTAEWRESRTETLAAEAAERDVALGMVRTRVHSVHVKGTMNVDSAHTSIRLPVPGLSAEQSELWHELQRLKILATKPSGEFPDIEPDFTFTEDGLAKACEGLLAGKTEVIRRHLEVLAALGFIIPLSQAYQRQQGMGRKEYRRFYRFAGPHHGDASQPQDFRQEQMARLARLLKPTEL